MRALIDTNVLLDFLLGNADYIVTRNRKDFETSEVPAILPEDFLKVVQI